MPKIVRLIPLIIATLLCLVPVIVSLTLSIEVNGESGNVIVGNSIYWGLLGLTIVWLGVILKQNIWAILFIVLLICSWSPYVDFTAFSVLIHFFSIRIDPIAFLFIFVHLLMNIDIILGQDKKIAQSKREQENNENVVGS